MLEPIDSARDDAASSPPPARQGRSGSAKRAPLPGLPEQGENERPGAMGAGNTAIEHGPERKVNGVPRRMAEISRAEQALGFKAQVTLEEGLSGLVQWWQGQKELVCA